ncbi:MAG TPA: hypothetical protein VIE88_08440, partial [Vicinamibacteria bacterium]
MRALAARLREISSPVVVAGGERAFRARLLSELGVELARHGAEPLLVTADPALPFHGPPGAVTRLRWTSGSWAIERVEPLCTLDAARFRLPVVLACRHALEGAKSVPTFVEVPRLTRGMGSSELLSALVQTLGVETVVWIGGESELQGEITSLGADLIEVAEEKGPTL